MEVFIQQVGAYICNNINEVVNILQSYQKAREEAILNVYICPKYFINNTNESMQYSGQDSPIYLEKTFSKPTNLNGYTPINKKLLTFPYCYINCSNNAGTTNSYIYELFNNEVKFNIKGVPVLGGSIKCVPYNYKNNQEYNNENEGIIGGKYPALSWSNDPYTNWLTQNAVNIGIGTASNLLTIIGGIASGNPIIGVAGITAGAMGIANQIGQFYKHDLVPNTAKGNTNSGDINTCSNTNTFIFEKMCIREEYAKIIDDYFSRYGYKINRITTPNITGRKNFNYIEIGSQEEIGNGEVPSNFMETINKACRRGTTVWHNHSNIGNFTLDNSVI